MKYHALGERPLSIATFRLWVGMLCVVAFAFSSTFHVIEHALKPIPCSTVEVTDPDASHSSHLLALADAAHVHSCFATTLPVLTEETTRLDGFISYDNFQAATDISAQQFGEPPPPKA